MLTVCAHEKLPNDAAIAEETQEKLTIDTDSADDMDINTGNMIREDEDIAHPPISVETSWVTNSSLRVIYSNNTAHMFTHGYYSSLQVFVDDSWQDIFPEKQQPAPNVALALNPGSSFVQIIDLSGYTNLGVGRYRVVKHMLEFRLGETAYNDQSEIAILNSSINYKLNVYPTA